MCSNEESLRLRVYNFYENNLSRPKSFTVAHFMTEGVPRQTIYDILRRFDNGIKPERQPGSGRIAKIFTAKKISKLEKEFENNDKVSIRSAAGKFNASKSWLHETLTTKTSIKRRKKKTIPDRTENQKALAKSKCGRMIRKFAGRSFLLDDESYFTLSHSTISGNDGFYTSEVSSAPANVKYATKKKFEGKVLVWITMGPKGLSRPLIRKSGYAINAQRYLDECIRRRLVPYIRSNYGDNEYVFWPDQASSHYSKIVIDHLRAENVVFVEKHDNPANVPEIRPIEDFWAHLKAAVYAKGWKAKNTAQLITRIKYCLNKFDDSLVHKLASSVKSRIDHVRRYGLIECK